MRKLSEKQQHMIFDIMLWATIEEIEEMIKYFSEVVALKKKSQLVKGKIIES